MPQQWGVGSGYIGCGNEIITCRTYKCSRSLFRRGDIMATLKELTIKYDVDALELGYTRHYSDILESSRYDITKVLEIGVETGRSHRMWLEYFENANHLWL